MKQHSFLSAIIKVFTASVLLFGLSANLKAQYCGFSGPSVCSPDINLSGQVTNYNNFTCIKRGIPFSNSFSIRIPQIYNLSGFSVPVQNVVIDSITNLPCGMCWSTDALQAWVPGDVHCINIEGTTFDSVGIYKLNIQGTATIIYMGSPIPVRGSFDVVGIQFYVRVIDSAGVCPAVIVQPGDTGNHRQACTVSILCPTVIPISISQTIGSACNYTGYTCSIPLFFTQPFWEFVDLSGPTNSHNYAIQINHDANQWTQVFTVSAVDSNGCHITMNSPVPTSTGLYMPPHICIVSLDSSIGHNVIVWNRDYDDYESTINRYNLYSGVDSGTLSALGTIDYNSETVFIDTVNVPESGTIKYMLAMQDTCGHEIQARSVFSPPLLHIDTVGSTAHLTWNFVDAGSLDLLNNTTTRLWKSYDSLVWTQIIVGAVNYIGTGSLGLAEFSLIDTLPLTGKVVYMVEILMPGTCHASPVRSLGNYKSVFSNRVSAGDTHFAAGVSETLPIPEKNLVLYPNPTTDQLFVEAGGLGIDEIKIYNTIGILLSQTKLPQSRGIDISQLSTGVYIAEIKIKEMNVKRRWVKM